MTKIFNLKKVILFISLFFTFYLWDIKNNTTSLDGRLLILLYLPFFFKDFFKINKVAIYLTAALFTHYIISSIYLGNTIATKNIIQLVAIYYLIIFSFNIQDDFFKIMPGLIRIFIILFFILTLSDSGSYVFKEAQESSSCAWLLDATLTQRKVIFGENSHFGMIAPASIIYFIFTLNQKNIKRDALIYTPMLIVILFVYLSTTLQAGIFFSIIALLFIFKKKHAFHYLLLLSLLVFTTISVVTKKECSSRLTRMNVANYTQLVLFDQKFKLAEKNKIKLEQLEKEKLKILNEKALADKNEKALVEEYTIKLEQLKKEELKILNEKALAEENRIKLAEENRIKLGEKNKIKLEQLEKEKLKLLNEKALTDKNEKALVEEYTIKLEQLKKEELKILNEKALAEENRIKLAEENRIKLGEKNRIKLEQLKKEELKLLKIEMEAELWRTKEKEILEKINKTDSVYINPNITVEVYQNAFLVTFYSLLEKKIGYGIENYKIAFNEYTPNNVMKSDNVTRNAGTKRGNLTPEILHLNQSDARSNLLKMITEFGFFSIIIFLFFLLFFFKTNIKIENKVFLVSIVLTQLVSGAGYFNGGFLLSICLMISLYTHSLKSKKSTRIVK